MPAAGRCLQRAGACSSAVQVVVELNLAARPGGFGAAERELPALEGGPPRFEGPVASQLGCIGSLLLSGVCHDSLNRDGREQRRGQSQSVPGRQAHVCARWVGGWGGGGGVGGAALGCRTQFRG